MSEIKIGDIVTYGEQKFIVAGGVRTNDGWDESRDYEFAARARPVRHYLTIGLVDMKKLGMYMQEQKLENISLTMDHHCVESAVIFNLSGKAGGRDLFTLSRGSRPDNWCLQDLLSTSCTDSIQSEPEASSDIKVIGHLSDRQDRKQTFDGGKNSYDISLQELEAFINPNAAAVTTRRQLDEVQKAHR